MSHESLARRARAGRLPSLAPPGRPPSVERQSLRDGPEPCSERARLSGSLLPCDEERLLEHIFDVGIAPQNPPGDGADEVRVRQSFGQAGESFRRHVVTRETPVILPCGSPSYYGADLEVPGGHRKADQGSAYSHVLDREAGNQIHEGSTAGLVQRRR